MKLKICVVLFLTLISCNNFQKGKVDVSQNLGNEDSTIKNLDLEVYDYDGFEKFLNQKNNKIYVINFWATWCAPCVKELPYFEKLNLNYKNEKVEVILVSLDFPHLYDSKLKPFIKERKLASKVIALNDVDMNTWIPKVDETWSGSIPATIIYKNDTKKFFERSFTYDELETELKQFLK
ncbi:TlpA disulfide reductase family protein [Litoribaculum gwangyangense]|uniref:TlpA family protein disulfide reductase n=1 Tax=Litoribaculum gwangyangense TaxID=1130722 RepID=UPI0031EA8AEA